MRLKLLLIVAVLSYSYSFSIAQQPEVFLVKADRLKTVKERIKSGDPEAVKWQKTIIKDAESMLTKQPGSVIDKNQAPSSGNKHDYMSMAPYYWPDSSKPGYVPYMRRDGERNPEIYLITDHTKADEMERAVQSLALGYYFTGEEKYAQKASQFLNTWFIDTATKMNPNLKYAQAVKGVNDGRGTGLIETVGFSTVLNTVGLLDGSTSWTKKDKNHLNAWFSDYLTWMLESKNGKAEHKSKNNHGIWYDMQIVSIELFLGKKEMAKEYLTSTVNRVKEQIEPDGKQPLELARTKALSYSTFSLEAWFKTATLADNIGVDIWHYSTADGRSMKKAFDWLIPYAMGDKKWEYKQIQSYSKKTLYRLLLQASDKYQDAHYYDLAMKIKDKESNTVMDIFYNK